MCSMRYLVSSFLVCVAVLVVAGCTVTPDVPPPGLGPEIPPAIKPEEITGRWGLAAFHKPEDLKRTEAAARGRVMTVRFLDPEVSGRYGTQIFVRCAPRS